MITKLKLKTPGRELDGEETKLYTREDMNRRNASDNQSALILEGLGGRNNLSDLDCCATRLRVTVRDSALVNEALLKQSGASGVICKGNGIQIIYGPQVSVVKSRLEDYMENPDAEKAEIPFDEVTAENNVRKEAVFSSKIITLYSPLKGKVVELSEVDDEAFSSKALGEGIAIEPTEGRLYAPCGAKVDMVFDTKHAINLISAEGCEILLHIGIDTVKLGGKYFEAHVSEGQQVRKGELLISFDIERIAAAGYSIVTPMVVCNAHEYGESKALAQGAVNAGEELIIFERK